ncbi:diacylglycerol/lipid kinase family protein [Oceanobacillus sp. CAU 1775]
MYVFIVNPQAGNGRSNFIFEKLQKSATYQELNTVYYYSEYEGHAEVIAASLLETTEHTIEKIIVVGGDGTIHEVMNGLGNTDIPVGFIPGGSGNDFARGVGIKGSPEEILEKIVSGENIVDYWLGNYEKDGEKQRYFVNSMGFGFDAATAHTANHSFYKKYFNQLRIGTASYVIAILQVLLNYKRMTFHIYLDGEKKTVENCWLVSIGNHPFYGGGMKIMPNAKVQADKFSVLIVHSLPKWKVLALFMLVFTGKHDKIKGVELLEAEQFSIETEDEIYMQVDGQTMKCMRAEVSKHNQKIKIIST